MVDHISDSNIPCVRAPNPILDARAEVRLTKAKALYVPSLPLGAIRRAQEAASGPGVTFLLLVALVATLTRRDTVRINPALSKQAGLGEDQTKRAAGALAEAGLIAIASAPGRRREITLLDGEVLARLKANHRGVTP